MIAPTTRHLSGHKTTVYRCYYCSSACFFGLLIVPARLPALVLASMNSSVCLRGRANPGGKLSSFTVQDAYQTKVEIRITDENITALENSCSAVDEWSMAHGRRSQVTLGDFQEVR